MKKKIKSICVYVQHHDEVRKDERKFIEQENKKLQAKLIIIIRIKSTLIN